MKRRSGFLKASLAIVIAALLMVPFIPTAFAAPGDDALTSAGNPILYGILHAAPYNLGNAVKITRGEMASLHDTLDLSNKGITSIEGLEYCTGITSLNLNGNTNLADLSPLENVEAGSEMALQTLSLIGTKVAVIPEALEMPHLTTLNLSQTLITDTGLHGISASNMGNLTTIVAKNCSGLHTINNIAVVPQALTSLTSLDLDGSALTALPADMSGMTHLQQLFLEGDNGIGNAAMNSIAGLPSLTVLDIDNCGISNINPLVALTGLQQLYISHNPVANISTALAGMSNLNTLGATYTYINNIGVLTGKPLLDLNLAVDYLDSTPGSDDMNMIDSLKSAGCNVSYNDQVTFKIHYICDAAIFEENLPPDFSSNSPPDVTVYYGQDITLPGALAKPTYAMTGWSVDYNSSPEYNGGQTIPVTWPTFPIPSTVPLWATTTTLDAAHQLSALASSAALTPAFDPDTSFYYITLPSTVGTVTLTPQAASAPAATFTINEDPVSSKTVSIQYGTTTTVTINVLNSGSCMQYFVMITRAKDCTVAFDVQGGSTAVASVLADYNTIIPAAPTSPTREGYSFGGWYPTPACNTTKTAFPYTIPGNVTLYAKWIPNDCTITFNPVGGDAVSEIQAKYDSPITLPDAHKPGFLFGGWYTDATYATAVSTPYTVKGSTTLYAKWNNSYKSTYAAKKIPAKGIVGTFIIVLNPLTPKGYTPVSVIYESDKPAVASVDSNGTITFLSAGKATITVTLTCQKVVKGITITKTVKIKKAITVTQLVSSIVFAQGDKTIAKKAKVTLAPSIIPGTASNQKLKWKSSNAGIASVSSTGVVTGKKAGEVTITCTAQDGSKAQGTCKVTVTP